MIFSNYRIDIISKLKSWYRIITITWLLRLGLEWSGTEQFEIFPRIFAALHMLTNKATTTFSTSD